MMKRLLSVLYVVLVFACALSPVQAQTPAQGTVTLNYTLPTQDVNGNPLTGSNALTAINIYEAPGSGSALGSFTKIGTASATGTTFTTAALAAGTYSFELTAVNASGESAKTNPVAATIVAPNGVPNSPTTVTVTVTITVP